MKRFFTCLGVGIFLLVNNLNAQIISGPSFIKEMKWGVDYQINLTLGNDSVYSVNLKDLTHSQTLGQDSAIEDFVYYPVMLARDFVDKLKSSKDLSLDTSINTGDSKPSSLWGALHTSIGGGWIHFINCLQYSLEKNYLVLTAPLMERPKSGWRPKPATPTWKRTKDWKYYIPVDQKQAQKEYQLKKKENNLANLQDVPADFIKLFENTNNKEYNALIRRHDYKTQSKIDLVKLLIGANYLGNVQISYIKSMVLKSIVQYSFNQLPTIIVFDDLEAAAAMSLNENGYYVDKVVFKDEKQLTPEEKDEKQKAIEQSVRVINKANQKILEEKLKKYYR